MAKLFVEIDREPDQAAGQAAGMAHAWVELEGRRALVAEHLWFGTESDYTGGVDHTYRVELHSVDGAWLVRVTRFQEIHYGPSDETVEVSSLDPKSGALVRLADSDPLIAKLTEKTLDATVSG